MAATIEEKALAYLVDARIKVVTVNESAGIFHAAGSGKEPYTVRFNGTWACTCPARIERCAHIQACQIISDFTATGKVTMERDEALDELLGGPPAQDLDGYDPFEGLD